MWSSHSSRGPRYIVEPLDDTTPSSQIRVTYGVAPSCPSFGEATSTTAPGAMSRAITLSDEAVAYDLSAEDASSPLCLAIWAEDAAGNTDSLNVAFRFATHPAPAYLEAGSSLYDAAANPDDMLSFNTAQGTINLWRLSGVATTGYVVADMLIANPWDEALLVKPQLTGSIDLQLQTEQKALYPHNRQADATWYAQESVRLRNPRASIADDLSSEATTGGPRFSGVCTNAGGAFIQHPLQSSNNTAQASSCMGTAYVHYRSPFRATLPLPGYDIETLQAEPYQSLSGMSGLVPILSVHRLENDGSLGASIVPDGDGYYQVGADQRAVALWRTKHASFGNSYQLLPTPGTGSLDDDNCGLLTESMHGSTYAVPLSGSTILFRTFDDESACFGMVPAQSNAFAYCGGTGGTVCRVDKVWRELSSLRVKPGNALLQTTKKGLRTSPWAGTGIEQVTSRRQIP